jgi:hypothetical protein
MRSGGHVFIIDGDVTKLACDAWLLPSDGAFSITESFCHAVGMARAGRLTDAPADWGNVGCMLLDSSHPGNEPDLWIGDIGRLGATPEHYAQRAVEFIARASAVVRQRTASSQQPPLLAMNVIGSGFGGQRRQRGALLAALLPAIHEAASDHRCDVVLVSYGSVMYAAAQSARNAISERFGAWSELPPELRTVGDQLADHARTGNLVVFMGAGVSAAAGLPTWRQLLAMIGQKVGISVDDLAAMESLDPRDQATIMQRMQPDRFHNAVEETLGSERPSLLHGLLASLPVREYVTTNFDTLFEGSARSTGRTLAVIPGEPVTSGDQWLLKLHGTIGQDLVLTRGDFIGASRHHAALRGLVQAMLLTRHMLFVGYSLSDEDFHLLVHEVRSTAGEEALHFGTALMPVANPLMEHLWSDINIVDTSRPGDDIEIRHQASARRLAILLDYVGSQAVSRIGFVADDSLGRLRSDEEAELADVILKLRDLLSARQQNLGSPNSGWDEVQRFLDLFPPTET